MKLVGETRKEYESDRNKYFRNLKDVKRPGPSADEASVANKHLPSKEEEHKKLEYYTKGFTKTSRSGSFSKPNAGPAIFPNGLKFASDFIDREATPGIHKQPETKGLPRQRTGPTGFAPKAGAVITDICMDCLEPADMSQGLVCAMQFMLAQDSLKLFSMNLHFGDPVLYVLHKKCADLRNMAGQLAPHIPLVRGGSIPDLEKQKTAAKYNLPLNIHDGNEITLGQYAMHEHQERIDKNLENYLISVPKDSEIFLANREKANGN